MLTIQRNSDSEKWEGGVWLRCLRARCYLIGHSFIILGAGILAEKEIQRILTYSSFSLTLHFSTNYLLGDAQSDYPRLILNFKVNGKEAAISALVATAIRIIGSLNKHGLDVSWPDSFYF